MFFGYTYMEGEEGTAYPSQLTQSTILDPKSPLITESVRR